MENFVKVKNEIINYWERKHFYNEFNTNLIEEIRSMSEFKEINLEEYLHFLDSDERHMVFEFLSDLTNHIIEKGKQKEEKKLIPKKQVTVSKITAPVVDEHSQEKLDTILSNLPEFDISVNNEFQSDKIPAQSTPIGQEGTSQQQQQQLLQTIPEETSISELARQQIREVDNTRAEKEIDFDHMLQQQQHEFSDDQTPAMSIPQPVFTSVSRDRNEIEEIPPDDESDEILKEFRNLFINQENPIKSLTPEIFEPRNQRMDRNIIIGMDKKFRRHRDVVIQEVTDYSKYSIFPLIYYNDAIEDFYNVIMNLKKIDRLRDDSIGVDKDDEVQLLTNNTIHQVSSQPITEEGRIRTTPTIPDPTLQSLQQNDSEQNRFIETPHLENIITTPHGIETPFEATDSLNQQSKIITPQLFGSGEDDIIPNVDDNQQLLGPMQQLDVIHEEIQNDPKDDNIVQSQEKSLSTDEIRKILEINDEENQEIIASKPKQQISSIPKQQNEDDSKRNWLDILRSNKPALSYRNLTRSNLSRRRRRRRRILFDDDIAEIIPPKRSRTRRNEKNIAQENIINEILQSELEQQPQQQQNSTEIMQETCAGEIREPTSSQQLKFERFKINLKKWLSLNFKSARVKDLKRLRNCTKYDINILKNTNSCMEIIEILTILLEKKRVKKYEILPADLIRSQAVSRIRTILDLDARGIISIKQNKEDIEEIELNDNDSVDVTE